MGPTKAERITDYINIARDHLTTGNARFFGDTFPAASYWRLYENFSEEACFLDIETTGLDQRRDDVTVVGLYQDGEMTTLVRDHTLSQRSLVSELEEAKLLVTFNGKQFDVPFLEHAFDINIDMRHLDLMYPCRQVNLTGGLKRIEQTIGIERDRPDLSGKDAVRLWRAYERGNETALETLISYNQEDVTHLETLADVVTTRLHEEVFASAHASSSQS